MKRSHTRVMQNKALLASGLLLMLLLGSALFPRQAKAASGGCEHNPVTLNGLTSYACVVLAQPCLREYDLLTHTVVGCLPFGSTISVSAQYQFSAYPVNGGTIWDQLKNGNVVSDFYVNTSHYNAFSPPLPQCTLIGGNGWVGGSCHDPSAD
jgi:hypothetical protein